MPAATPAPAPVAAPEPTLTASQILARGMMAAAPPWWFPPWANVLAVGLFGMVAWIMYTLAPIKGHPPDELFKLLAQAIVLTAFIGGPVAVAYTMSQNNKKQNDTIAAQAATIAAQNAPPQPGA